MFKYLPLFILASTVGFAQMTNEKLQESLETTARTQNAAKASQIKVNNLHNREQELFARYKDTLTEIQTLKVYNKQLQALVNAQEVEKQSINEQILEVDLTAQGIMPLMKKMIEGLQTFTHQDLPFLKQEREKRATKLSTLLSKPKLTVSQKYRSIMEAFAIELEYGNTLETYVSTKGDTTVQFLKVGRIGLYYLSLDEKSMGMYDKQKNAFVSLDESYIKHLKRAIKIAKKQQAPELLELPVQRTHHDMKEVI